MVFYKKSGFPSRGDIVLCKIKKILPHSAFAQLVEYENKEGMIHVSEVSSRWTKNISDIISVDEQVVCRVENVDTEKGYIDLSIKRVTSGEEKKKKDEIKNENRIEKLIEHAGKVSNVTLEAFYKDAGFNIVEEYGSLQGFYDSYLEDKSAIDKLKVSKQFKDSLKQAFDSLLQKSRVNVNNRIKFFASGPNGVENIKFFVKEVIKTGSEEDNKVEIKYIDAPEYLVSINSKNYKESNAFFERIVSLMGKLANKYDIKIL